MKPTTVAFALMLCAAFAAVHAQTAQLNTEQRVFGSQRSATSINTATQQTNSNKETASTENKSRRHSKLKPRAEAMRMYKRYNSGDLLYASLLKEAANNGNGWAALQYGYLAHKGNLPGLKGPDLSLAYKAYTKAVKNPDGSLTGNYLAAYNLGLLFYFGGGQIKQNGKDALHWFQTASQAYREDKRSEYAIFWPASFYTAQILQNGYKGVPANKSEARKYWQEAIRSKDPTAFYGYAVATYPENPFVAVRYYQSAANRWHVPSMIALARWYANGDKFHESNPEQTALWLLIAAYIDKRYTANADTVLRYLNAESKKRVQTQASRWIQSKGLQPVKFDYASPLNDDPVRYR